ncbi:uncharacterized protein LOC108735862 [Agrilus planipennis]|uniref:Uncharacterized protein LOC108735862 n=1 Tax=Agrilus planipennis TaxID=224129 RepID=A0A1W4WI06_AGRPL|nr:uncharacterized protein LOC108735862 [Agrilus planipennis]
MHPRSGSLNTKRDNEDADGLEEDNCEIKTLKINTSKWKTLHHRLLQHHCLFECPVSNPKKTGNYAIKFEKRLLQDTDQVKALFNPDDTTNIGLPYPLTFPGQVSPDVDPCTKLVIEKDKYRQDLQYYRSVHKTHKGRIEFIKEKEFCVLPKYLIDISKGALKDPDPFFKGSYDWYYTGGIIDTINLMGIAYTVYPIKNGSLGIIESDEHHRSHELDCDLQSDVGNPIYSLRSNEFNKGFATLLRKKYELFLVCTTFEDDLFQSSLVWKRESLLTPYIDFKIDLTTNSQIATVDLSHCLQLLDLESNKVLNEYSVASVSETLPDQLAQIEYLNSKTILCTNRKTIQQLDLNSGELQKFNVKADFYNCDDVCCFVGSQRNNKYIYVATTHNLLKIDLRNMRKTGNYLYVNKWAHMMTTPPVVMSYSVVDDDFECLYLSGPKFSDKVLLNLSTNTQLPAYVPNIDDALNTLNLTGNIRYGEEIRERVRLCNAGNGIIKARERNLTLVTANSVGDVFEQEVTHRNPPERTEQFARWLDQIPKKRRPLEITGVSNMGGYFFGMINDDADEYYLKKMRKENKQVQRLKDEFFDLDITDPKFKAMNAVWEDENLDDTSKHLADEVTPKLKVTEWLQTANESTGDLSGFEYLSDIQF